MMQTVRYPNMSQWYRPLIILLCCDEKKFRTFRTIYVFIYLFVIYLTTLPVTQTNTGSTVNSTEFGRRRA